MKNKLFLTITALTLFSFPKINFGQAPNLGTAADFVLFSTVGAVTNTGISQVTGNVGTNSGSSTGFGNVNGVMHDGDGASGICAADLLLAYNQLNATVPTFFPAPLLGNGQILNAGVYSIAGPTVLNLTLTLDGQGNPNAVFIFQIGAAFSANANSKVTLINGAKACNVFWQVEGLVSMATGTTMRGTIVANNAAINIGTGDTLEGRALTTSGAITIDGVLAYTPIGCGSLVLTGPVAPNLASAACYSLFSSDGPVTNVGVTNVVGDIGTDLGTTTGYNPLLVVGAIHGVPDGSTAACATDLLNAYNYLNTLPFDIELLYPVQFGNSLVLTPHTYLLNAATTFTDSLYLNAEGNPNAVFVIQINGALTTSTFSRVVLINGTQARNVYWKVDGAVTINDNSVFIGTIVCNNGAMNLNTGVTLYGRALTTTGALATAAVNVVMPPGCGIPVTGITTEPVNQTVCVGGSATFSVVATGTGITYQWRKGNLDLVNGGNISGATTATLTINPVTLADAAINYNVVIAGSPNDTSINVSLTVNTAPNITTQPVNQTVCAGGSVSFSVTATGGGLTYQWKKGLANVVNGVNISGATTATLTINPVAITDTSANYYVVVSGTCLPNDTSLHVVLTVNPAQNITSQPVNQTACVGGSVSFSVAATGSGLIYQWKKGLANVVNGINISGATTATLTINPVTIADTSSNYYVVISGACLPNDTSIKVSLMLDSPVITTEPVNQTACAGTSVSFSVTATGSGLIYQWKKGLLNVVNGINISGATTATLTINPATIADTSSNYYVVITGACLPNDTSLHVSLIINVAPNITTQPISQTVCAGTSVSFSVTAAGNGLVYQWKKGLANVVNGINISGATTATLTINPANISDTSSSYYVLISGTCLPKDTSLKVSLIINTAPNITTQPVNQTVCAGTSVSFSVNATGTGIVYQWKKGIANVVNGANISGATTATLTINPANISDTSSNYYVVISGTCLPNDTSLHVSLMINAAPNITAQPVNQTVCAGGSVSFSVTATGNGLIYQWKKGIANVVNGANISGATTATLTINPANISDTSSSYYVVISGTCLPNDTSLKVSLIVTQAPVAVAGSNSPVCAGSPINFTAQTSAGATYGWAGPNAYSSSSQNPVIAVAALTDAGTYTLTVSATGCPSASSTVNIIVNNCLADLTITKTVDNSHPIIGHTIVFTITVSNNGPSNATGVAVNETLQSGFAYVSSTTTTGTYDPATGVWTIGTMNNGATEILTVTATVLSGGNYTNTAIIYGNELDATTANNNSSIELFPTDFFIPEGFSPNGDGINDLFVIRGINNFPNNTFEIFNRWGNKIFGASPYTNTWDGKSTAGMSVGGSDLPVGTYFYLLDLGDGSAIIKGTIYLNR